MMRQLRFSDLHEGLTVVSNSDDWEFLTKGSAYEVHVDEDGDSYVLDDEGDRFWIWNDLDCEHFEISSEPESVVRILRREYNHEKGTLFIDLEVDEAGEREIMHIVKRNEKVTQAANIREEISQVEGRLSDLRKELRELEN